MAKAFWEDLAEKASAWAKDIRKEERREERLMPEERLTPIPVAADGLKVIKLNGVTVIGVPAGEEAYLLTERKVWGIPEYRVEPFKEVREVKEVEKPLLTTEEREKIREAIGKIGEEFRKGIEALGKRIEEFRKKREEEKKKEAEKMEKEEFRRLAEKLGIEVL
jgi:hypothetical protein